MVVLKKTGRILLRTVIVMYLLLALILLCLDSTVQFRSSDRELKTYFTQKHEKVLVGYYESGGRKIRYIGTGNDTAQTTILFIHGAPSSCDYFKEYLSNDTLQQKATMYAVDRPGYGYSGLGDPEPSIQKQAAMIRPILDSLHKASHPVIVMGVSFGTAIACRLVMDNPGLVDGLVLVAPALGPGLELVPAVCKPADNPLISWMVPRMLVSANAEKLHHEEELRKMLPYWKNIRIPVKYLQGADDGLLYTTNADFARRHLVNAASLDITLIPGRGHLIAFLEKDRIEKALLQMIDLSRTYYEEKKDSIPAKY